jgi:hypothetical protein
LTSDLSWEMFKFTEGPAQCGIYAEVEEEIDIATIL